MLAEAVRNTQASPNQTLKGVAKAQRMETAAIRVD